MSPPQKSPVVPYRPPSRGRGLSDRALQRVNDCIRANLAENLSLPRLAAAACISRFHFARLFRARTGMSPMQYVRNERVAMAKYLLASGGTQSLSRVAAALGFFDQSHFTRVFSSVTGLSPGQYARAQATPSRASAAGAGAAEEGGCAPG
ncbi:helix-turn-helix domain-containing protein [Tahibacter caeni]|uniref:helix-turn-helix domain-containing protein n=1 Tax=Tahibacter caeni TaxID=1453545 RepID=UPI002147B352|nr:AraC family transcriptional regulator [Tahibacter caeni]